MSLGSGGPGERQYLLGKRTVKARAVMKARSNVLSQEGAAAPSPTPALRGGGGEMKEGVHIF